MTDQSSTGPADRSDAATAGGTAGGTRSNDDAEPRANHGDDPGAGRQGPMVSDAAIDWTALGGSGDAGDAVPGAAPRPESADGDATASR
jgi:hypothetical protein